MVARLALLAAIVAAPACYTPAFRDCELACSARGTCPEGFECAGQVCRPTGATTACPVPMPDAPDGGEVDAPIVGHPTTRWSLQPEAIVHPQGLHDPTLVDDRLELYAVAGPDIVVATRGNVNGAWSNFVPAGGVLNSTIAASDVDDAPSISSEGLVMHWTSSRAGGKGGLDIWRAVRPSRGQQWGGPTPVAELNSTSGDTSSSLSGDRRMIAFASTRGGAAQGDDLYYATRGAASAMWDPPNPIAELNTAGSDGHPSLSPDKLTIYFQSDRLPGLRFELFEAHRPSITAPFGAPRHLDELSTDADESDPWVSADGRHLYFTRVEGGLQVVRRATR